MDTDLLKRFTEIVGPKGAVIDPSEDEPALAELRKLYIGKAAAILRPSSTEEVSEILRLATETKTPIVPQGGNTGLVGGQIPDDSGSAIILQLGRMDAIRKLDPDGMTMTVESGAILQNIRAAADDQGLMFPLSLASQGSAQIGGLLSTNAGGVNVLAYGNARDLCLGVEVVLPDGRILPDLRALKKDNTGYDLKNLFIGAEGTLGIITAAVLKLIPRPAGRQSGWAGLSSAADALRLMRIAERVVGSSLTAFELIQRPAFDLVLKHWDDIRDPLDQPTEWAVLFEISSGRSDEEASQQVEAILTEALEEGIISDAVITASLQQYNELWRIRETLPDAQRFAGPSIKHDISVPVSAIPDFIERAEKVALSHAPEGQIVCFGHMGDGNLHYNVQGPADDGGAFIGKWKTVTRAVHDLVREMDGSISAEHGIGQMKRDELVETAPPVAIELMRTIRNSFDPAGIMNPGKLF